MDDSYIEYNFTVNPREPGTEILIAELAEVGFDSFKETESGVCAYIPSHRTYAGLLEEIPLLGSPRFKIQFETKTIEQRDWNTKWEKRFQPIAIGKKCRIRAPFHQKKPVRYDIVIQPKMAFGTGHHATTELMVRYLLEENLSDKTILDMGCGTGILAILASMRGAKSVDAIDIDPWSYENTLENAHYNNCQTISVFKGGAEKLDKTYDLICANINRNILLRDLKTYSHCLVNSGTLLLSGFYKEDLPAIQTACLQNDLHYQSHSAIEGWTAVKCEKAEP